MPGCPYEEGSKYEIKMAWGTAIATCTAVTDVEAPEGWVCTFEDEEELPYPVDIFVSAGHSERWQNEMANASGMPAEYVRKDIGYFNWDIYESSVSGLKDTITMYLDNAREFYNSGTGLYLFAKSKGCGKTFLACCVVNSLIRKGFTAQFVGAPAFADLVLDKTDSGKSIYAKLFTSDFVIFDDVGAGGEDKDWISRSLFNLVDAREREKRPTIWTSNLPVDDIKTDERTKDRIYSTSLKLKLPEEQIRRKIADNKQRALVSRIRMGVRG